MKEANLAPCLVLAGVWHSVLRCRDGDGDEMEMWMVYGDGASRFRKDVYS